METSEVMRNLRNATWPSPSSAFLLPLPPFLHRPTITHGMTKTAPEPAHAPARLRRALYGKSKWHLPSPVASARWMGREPVSLTRGSPHTISLGDRPTDRVSHRHFEKQLTKRNERLARRRRRRGGPSPSRRPFGQVTLAASRSAGGGLRQNDKMMEQLPRWATTTRTIGPFSREQLAARRADIMSTKHSSFVHFTLSLLPHRCHCVSRRRGGWTMRERERASWGPDVTRTPDLE